MILSDTILEAARSGALLQPAADQIGAFLAAPLPGWAKDSIGELVSDSKWGELNDRFYRPLEFGTGGMRGRTIGAIVTAAERGGAGPGSPPEHAAIGSNMMNDLTLLRATIGLYRHASRYLRSLGSEAKPRLVVAYDVRHFSSHFGALAASAWTRLGGKAYLFDGPRPTPQLSYSVRWLGAQAGVVITASHNPPHDNGFKAYFDDGGQVVPPHDLAIVAEVNAVPLEQLIAFLDPDLDGVSTLGRLADDAYLSVVSKAAIDSSVFRKSKLRVVYTNLHGTGCVHSLPLLVHAACVLKEVHDQIAFDPNFSTVKSPNPENAEALSHGIALAESENCDVVLATDPDCDRMGAAVRGRSGKMELVTGNQIGALLADYRLTQCKARGWIPPEGSDHACLINTYVTTQLQDAIGRLHGVRVVKTLTGFKWIAAKLRIYEQRLEAAMGAGFDYDEISLEQRIKLALEHSSYFVFGCEESYGYLPNDYVRDKDGNAACLMFAELCAWVKGRGMTVPEYLDEIYLKCGYYREGVINIYYEGASGSAKIRRILDTYRSEPPRSFGGARVARFQDFGRERILDADGDEVPKQDLYFVTLENGYSFAARGSGTEPKMKFYLFGNEKVADAAALAAVKDRVQATLESLGRLVEADARSRAEAT